MEQKDIEIRVAYGEDLTTQQKPAEEASQEQAEYPEPPFEIPRD